MTVKRKKSLWRIFYRKNTGEDITTELKSLEECLLETKKLMTPQNYIICIKNNGERIKHWDREIISGSNKWYSCVVDDTEIPGRLIEINKITTPQTSRMH
ncbi:TPA: hypothetical protein O8U08_002013 [Enterobacter cloacae]|nr:hypothetical protein [Enterobacter cloacae]